ncbi:MAG TPA: chitobiase/beta-hexosaminidase C-terminal domain-containing protein [Opitutaceae bacterium]|nr:chitobiase/beta-hexosaminidase C-terminal domain-containing protein [Opitutaceae bacterium]
MTPSTAHAAANGLGQTPAMGWNSWMVYGKGYDYKKVEAQADALCAQIPGLPAGTTLQSLGYNYVCMDSGWRDESGVDSSGFAKADTTKFPNGVSDVANYVHAKGLKIGIYLTPGMLKAAYDGNYQIAHTNNPATNQPYTTQQIVVIPLTNGNTENSSGASYSYQIDFTKPGASQWIQNYADMLASWGVDYVMWDFVGPGGGNIPADDRTNMQQWFIATQATPAGSRPIWIKLSNSLSFTYASTWESVANSWRIDGDVKGTWTDISNRMKDSPQWAPFEGPGGWGDMDSLLVGAGNFYNSDTGATGPDERKTATTLWAVCCSPLILGQDLTPLNSGKTLTDISLITNPEVIAVDQAGVVATPSGKTAGVWRAKNPDGSFTVAIFNTGSGSATISCSFSNDLGFSGSATVRDLWARKDLGSFTGSFSSGSLNSHACRLVKVTPGGAQQVTAPVFNPAGGTYSSAQNVTITSSTSGATIRYTTDGSAPSETAGTIYSGPVNIASTATLEAIAYKSGLTDSGVTSASYTISSGGGTTVSFEAESLTYTPHGATASVQTDTNSSGGKWVVLSANAAGQYIDYAIPSVNAGTYQVQMEWKGNNTRGTLQLSVDGVNLGSTLDQYSSGQTYPTTPFGTVTFSTTGTHTVRLTVTGKNASSSGYGLSADKFTFAAQ